MAVPDKQTGTQQELPNIPVPNSTPEPQGELHLVLYLILTNYIIIIIIIGINLSEPETVPGI